MKDFFCSFRVQRTKEILAEPVLAGESFFTRARGMIGRNFHAGLQGIWFPRCSSIHMFFMTMPLDVLFLDGDGMILKLAPSVPPWTPFLWVPWADSVLELPAGTFEKKQDLTAGEVLIRMPLSGY